MISERARGIKRSNVSQPPRDNVYEKVDCCRVSLEKAERLKRLIYEMPWKGRIAHANHDKNETEFQPE